VGIGAMAVLGGASAVGSVLSQRAAASAQERAINLQLQQQDQQIGDQQAAEINDQLRAARREQARIKVAAGEAGLQLGGSVEALLQDSLMQAGLSIGRIDTNADNMRASARAQADSLMSRFQKPTILGSGLEIASGIAKGYATGKSLQLSRTSTAMKAAG